MNSIILSLVVLATAGACFAGPVAEVQNQKAFQGYKLYRLTLTSQEQLDFLKKMNTKIQERGITDEIEIWTDTGLLSDDYKQRVTMMVSPAQESDFAGSLTKEGIKYEITVTDLSKVIEEESRMSLVDQRAAASGKMTWSAYHRYATMEVFFEDLAQRFPDLFTKEVIGQSYEGRNLYLLKIGKARADGKMKPAVFMDSQIHAREWIASATLTYMINKMVTEYATDAVSRRMMDEIDWIVVPVVNPDGFEFTHAAPSNRMWRKTRRVNPFSSSMGADPNRNYDHKWMYSGSNQQANSDIYAGAFPFSEVENLHLTDAALKYKSQIKCLLTFHSAAEMWLLPWGFDSSLPADFADLRAMGVKATDALRAVYGIRYDVGSSTSLLGAAAGATDDWGKAKGLFKYSATVELRDQGYGFILPPAQIIPSGIETFAALNVVAQEIRREFGATLN